MNTRLLPWIALALACATGFAVAKAPHAPSAEQTLHVIAQVTPSEVRSVLDSLKVAYAEDRDTDGTIQFNLTGQRDPVTLSLRRDGAATFVTSLELVTTFSVKEKLSLSAANDWNCTNRFTRCSIDAEGRPTLASDLVVGDGVTQESLRTAVNLFLMSTRKFDKEVLTKRGL